MKELSQYETPDLEIIMIITEGILCNSGIESLDEKDGDWGW